MNVMFGPEMFLQKSGIFNNLIEDKQWFPPGNSGSESVHGLRFNENLFRNKDLPFICKNDVPVLAFPGKWAVPAAAVAASGHKKNHLSTFVAENTAFTCKTPLSVIARFRFHGEYLYLLT